MEDESDKVIALDPDIVDWTFSNDVINSIKHIRAICIQTTGYEWVDGTYCKSKGIALTNVPHYSNNAVAEKALFMALTLAKRFPLFQREGKMNWDAPFVGDDIQNKPVGIVGLGDIGLCLASKFTSIVGNDNIYYYSRKKINSNYQYMDFKDLIKRVEYLFITCSKNNDNLVLFDDLSDFNGNMKVVIIANGFKSISDEFARVCEDGNIGGVAFERDLLDQEYTSNVFIHLPMLTIPRRF